MADKRLSISRSSESVTLAFPCCTAADVLLCGSSFACDTRALYTYVCVWILFRAPMTSETPIDTYIYMVVASSDGYLAFDTRRTVAERALHCVTRAESKVV